MFPPLFPPNSAKSTVRSLAKVARVYGEIDYLRPDMDFLKSAVASAISKGPPFPYSFGEVVPLDDGSIWTLYNGVKRVSLHQH